MRVWERTGQGRETGRERHRAVSYAYVACMPVCACVRVRVRVRGLRAQAALTCRSHCLMHCAVDFLEVLRPLRLGSGPEAQLRLHAAAAAGTYALFFAAFESHMASVVPPVGRQTLLWGALSQSKALGEGTAAAPAAASVGENTAAPKADSSGPGSAPAPDTHVPAPASTGASSDTGAKTGPVADGTNPQESCTADDASMAARDWLTKNVKGIVDSGDRLLSILNLADRNKVGSRIGGIRPRPRGLLPWHVRSTC
jgi:hypothetical protein